MARHRRTVPKVGDRLCCLIVGHKDKVMLGGDKLALHCARCGRTSPGWHLDGRRPA
jgi:hypothetical protein